MVKRLRNYKKISILLTLLQKKTLNTHKITFYVVIILLYSLL